MSVCVSARILCRIGRFAAFMLAVSVAAVAAADDDAASGKASVAPRDDRSFDSPVSPERVNALIKQLGHPRFTVRRAAANELRQIGPEAFDLLHAATSNADPEVAASARYLLRQISVRWVRSDDPPAVRRLLNDYGELTDELRSARVLQLARLSDGEGLAGLCRIARFDRSPLISRQAALAIIRPVGDDAKPQPVDADVIAQELGPSSRAAAVWLRQYVRQLADPSAAVATWRTLIADETTRRVEHADETSSEIVLGLLWNLAELYRGLGNNQAVIDTADQMVDLDENRTEQTAIDLLTWLATHKSWEILDAFLSKHQPRLEQSKRSLYAVALARADQGQAETADQLAQRAVKLDAQAPLEGFIMAKELEERSKFEWATREYRHVLDRQRVTADTAILARIELANMQFDHADHESAATTLEPLIKAIQEDEKVAQLYAEIQRAYYRRYGMSLPDSETLACRYHFYRAGQYHQEQDWQRERDELQLAINFDKTDADVLIAMYRSPEASEDWRASTRQQITQLCQQIQQEIDESPGLATPYNQWAWLVSNTEGDYHKAVRYSLKSIELNTGGKSAEASYLDTLGRCYYATGDFEKAIKHEHQAIERVGHMQVMRRQLQLFEKALAEKNAGRTTDDGDKKSETE